MIPSANHMQTQRIQIRRVCNVVTRYGAVPPLCLKICANYVLLHKKRLSVIDLHLGEKAFILSV